MLNEAILHIKNRIKGSILKTDNSGLSIKKAPERGFFKIFNNRINL
jgi:hypothetical protein